MIWCALRYGASPNNYVLFDWKHASPAERRTYLTHRDNVKLMKRLNDPDSCFQMENKLRFAQIMGADYKRPFFDSKQMSFEDFSALADGGKFIYKPVSSGQGRGIRVFQVEQDQYRVEYDRLHALPQGIVEQWLRQHPAMNSLNCQSVNPLRIQTLLDEHGAVRFMSATITIGNGTDYANASAPRSIFALVDPATGKVITDGCDYNGNRYEKHPVTGTAICGFQVPMWEKVLECVSNAASKFPGLRYVGWDVAVTEETPVVIEGNNDGGYTGYQYYKLIGVHHGTREKYEACL